MSPNALAATLSRMARAVSETLELKDVFARVVETAATVLPFDTMVLFQRQGPDTFALHSYAGIDGHERGTIRLEDFSPAIRPSNTGARRIDDVTAVLDPQFSIDRKLEKNGIRSLLNVAMPRRGDELAGFVGIGSRRPGAFTEDHEAALRSIADLLGLALEHERLWRLNAERRRRDEAIDALLGVFAETLDVRGIFNRVSEIVQPVLPHDRLVLMSLSADRREITLDAVSGEAVSDFPTRLPAGETTHHHAWEYLLIPDTEAEAEAPPCRGWCRTHGIRSLLKIPLRIDGGLGSLLFLSRTPHQYSEEDTVAARRVADHVSLALSHQRLAEEGRQTAAARARAEQLQERVKALRDELDSTRGYRRLVGESGQWKDVLTQAAKVAPTETTVLLTGESGTGKELVARAIHRGSPRADGPFVALNCAALPDTLLESELFGHEKGAFTGAIATRPGRIEQAAGGVLFLDEVGEMSPGLQAKMLRVLQEREFQRLGGARSLKADVRVVAATNRNLDAALVSGAFREDLYYRLRVFEIHLPPLRDRREDILPLAAAFLEEIGPTVGRPAAGISREARDALLVYAWPGNVRELRNALERASILCDGGLITMEHLPIAVARLDPAPEVGAGAGPAAVGAWSAGGVKLERVERDLIIKALTEARNNRSRAARLLGITRSQLYYRMQKHGLDARAEVPRSA